MTLKICVVAEDVFGNAESVIMPSDQERTGSERGTIAALESIPIARDKRKQQKSFSNRASRDRERKFFTSVQGELSNDPLRSPVIVIKRFWQNKTKQPRDILIPIDRPPKTNPLASSESSSHRWVVLKFKNIDYRRRLFRACVGAMNNSDN